jgi:tetratricopeptide (TPR) repeat protein
MGLANALRDQGQLGDDVERLYLEIIDGYRRRLGPENKPIQKARMRLAVFYYLRGEFQKAEPLARGTADTWRRDQQANHPDTLLAIHNLGIICAGLGRRNEAKALLGEALDGRLRVLGADDYRTQESARILIDLHDAAGEDAAADAIADRVVAGLPPDRPARSEFDRRP